VTRLTIGKDLIRELSTRLGVTDRRVYQRIKGIEDQRLISKEEAACLLAHSEGMSRGDIRRYFPSETVKNVSRMIQDSAIILQEVDDRRKKARKSTHKQNKSTLSCVPREPLLLQAIFDDARKMAEYYQCFYIFENSIRNFISMVMSFKYGDNWWQERVVSNQNLNQVCGNVNTRKKAENKDRFHGKRGAHEIYYTDIDDLRKIIETFFPDLKPFLKQPKSFLDHMLRTLNLSRRVIAHSNPLTRRDFERIKQAFSDWCDQLSVVKERLGEGNG
jgi:hypothetical protein